MRHLWFAGLVAMLLGSLVAAPLLAQEDAAAFVRVSPRDSRYFELSNGKPYIPIGLNTATLWSNHDIRTIEDWFLRLGRERGNFARVWIGHGYFDVEHQKSGQYDAERAQRIEQMLAIARKHGIRVKLCLEFFRDFDGPQKWANRPLHASSNGGPAANMPEFFTGDKSRAQFKQKLAWYAQRFGDHPQVFAWELWNEVDAVRAPTAVTFDWTKAMLPELHRLFPKNLAVQSLGSYDLEKRRETYKQFMLLEGNDVAQVHRYLDQGAGWKVCGGPVDDLAADAVKEMLAFQPGKPVLLAESGAVEPKHSGPFKLYEKDKDGTILHDVLFAAFFAGASGPGHIWHWDHYVAKLDLWWHFGRFAEAVKDLDPPAERFEVVQPAHDSLRVRALRGKRAWIGWIRDPRNTWMTELRDGQAPVPVSGAVLDLVGQGVDLAKCRAQAYDPWTNRWSDLKAEGTKLSLPEFRRSLVVRVEPRP